MKSRMFAVAGLAAVLTFGAGQVFAADASADKSVDKGHEVPVFELTLKDHMFTPDRIEVPAGVDVKLKVKNLDPSPEEFESYDLDVEKIIAGGTEGTFHLAPLERGEYKFFGEFHEDSAQGVLIAK